jgi:hypothetical protein
MLGKVYVITTIITCLTGFGIFQHGGFGKPQVLGIVTLAVLGVAGVARYTNLYGRASRYVEAIAYSATFFFALRERRGAGAASDRRGALRRVPHRRRLAGAPDARRGRKGAPG